MRIIAGKARGLHLDTRSGEDTRPTADRVKEALFSMLTPYLNGARVLDLFAGSGALGLEAVSRGAKACDFVEISSAAANIVLQNTKKAGFEDVCRLHRMDFQAFLKHVEESYDLIFLDPPYRSGFYENALSLIKERNLLAEEGRIVAEWDQDKPDFSAFYEEKERRYGRVHISILKG